MLVSCPLGSLCIGLMCTQRSGAGGRRFPGFDTDECQHCRCIEAADNPFMRCTTTVLSDENTPGIGLMGAVNFNLLAAAFALDLEGGGGAVLCVVEHVDRGQHVRPAAGAQLAVDALEQPLEVDALRAVLRK